MHSSTGYGTTSGKKSLSFCETKGLKQLHSKLIQAFIFKWLNIITACCMFIKCTTLYRYISTVFYICLVTLLYLIKIRVYMLQKTKLTLRPRTCNTPKQLWAKVKLVQNTACFPVTLWTLQIRSGSMRHIRPAEVMQRTRANVKSQKHR